MPGELNREVLRLGDVGSGKTLITTRRAVDEGYNMIWGTITRKNIA